MAVYQELLGETDRLPPDVADDVRWLLDQPLVPHGSDEATEAG